MKIKNNTIIDCSAEFKLLEKLMEASDYVVWFEARTFGYQGDANFNLNALKELFPNKSENVDNNVDGEVSEKIFTYAKQEINKCLNFAVEENVKLSSGEGYPVNNKIESTFWELVDKKFSLNQIHKVFRHEIYRPSYFGGYIMWGFCYIFLNEKDKVGIVISGGSAD